MTAPGGSGRDPLQQLRQLWLQPEQPAPALDAGALKRAASRLRRRVWLRNLSEWGAAALLLPLCAQQIARSERLGTRLGLLGIAVAGLYVSAVLYRRGRLGRQPESAATAEFLRGHVAALGQQAELLESVWRWYLLPFLPGITLIYLDAGWALLARAGATPGRSWLTVAGGWLLTCLVSLGVGALNRRAARALRREMAELTER